MTHPIRFVLCETSHPGNIGAAARAIKTMGFSDLALVDPVDFPSTEADSRASGATDVLRNALVCDTLEEAIADSGLVLGTSARRRRSRWPVIDSRESVERVLAMAEHKPVSIVFGTERSGLTNEQMDLCEALICIPSNPDYSSLNMASAVQLIAYEVYYAQQQQKPAAPVNPKEVHVPASSADMENFYEHLNSVMIGSGFLNPDKPRKLERKVRRLFNRAQPSDTELNILRGILTAVAKPFLDKSK